MVEYVRYVNQNATRSQPLNPQLVSAMGFLPELGLTMEVHSGGQSSKEEGGPRVGSTRHDHGGAGDVDFITADGRRLSASNPNDQAILAQVVARAKANGVTGFGQGEDYMGDTRIHLGFGNPGVWGANGKSDNAPEWLRAAYAGTPQGHTPNDGHNHAQGQQVGNDAMDALGLPRNAPQQPAQRPYDPYQGYGDRVAIDNTQGAFQPLTGRDEYMQRQNALAQIQPPQYQNALNVADFLRPVQANALSRGIING